jgi:hypothetical protein
MINESNFLWMIPYDIDIQSQVAQSYYNYLTLSINNIKDPEKDLFISEYSEDRASTENSEKRTILVPKSGYINKVESLLESYRGENRIE